MSAESGEYDVCTGYMSQLLSYFDGASYGLARVGLGRARLSCGYPQLVQDYRGTPVPGMGTTGIYTITWVCLIMGN